MSIIIFFNGDRGVSVLRSLILDSYQVSAIVTTPHYICDQELSDLIQPYGIKHLKFQDVNSSAAISCFKVLSPLVFIIAGFRLIFSQELIAIPKLGTLNLHAGKLPQYRGGSPLNWQIINGEREAGLSVILADEGIDTGSIMAEKMIPIDAITTIDQLHEQANRCFPKLTLEALKALTNGFKGYSQDNSKACYWHQRNDEDGYIDFSRKTIDQVDREIRALTKPYPGAWCWYQNIRLRIFKTEIPCLVIKGVPKRICYLQGNGPYIICADRGILLRDFLIENGQQTILKHGEHVN